MCVGAPRSSPPDPVSGEARAPPRGRRAEGPVSAAGELVEDEEPAGREGAPQARERAAVFGAEKLRDGAVPGRLQRVPPDGLGLQLPGCRPRERAPRLPDARRRWVRGVRPPQGRCEHLPAPTPAPREPAAGSREKATLTASLKPCRFLSVRPGPVLPSSWPASLPQGRPDRQGHGHRLLGTASDAERKPHRLRAAVPDEYARAQGGRPGAALAGFGWGFGSPSRGSDDGGLRPPLPDSAAPAGRLGGASSRCLFLQRKRLLERGQAHPFTRGRSCGRVEWP